MTLRDRLFDYIKGKYDTDPEYPWMRYPDYAVFRHAENQKWFGIVMNVSRGKLGLSGDETVDVLNVKLSDPFLVDILIRQPGYVRGYHIRRGN